MQYSPIILLASERSGTNLLRAILSSHPDIASPPPTGIMDILPSLVSNYLPFCEPRHLDILIEDVIALAMTHMNPWDIPLSQKRLLEMIDQPSLWSIFGAMNSLYAESKGCSHWFSKEPGLFRHIYEIALHFPNVKFVYMVRDGRDVVASMLKGGLHANNILEAAQRWSSEQKICLMALSDPLIKEKCFLIKYEELVQHPDRVISSLMRFLALEFHPDQLRYYERQEIKKHARSSSFWREVSKPIKPDNSGKYKSILSRREIEIFESISISQMRLLNYKLEFENPRSVSKRERKILLAKSLFGRKSKQFMQQAEVIKRSERNKVIQEITRRVFSDR